MLKTKSIREPTDPEQDGLRILATRYRGRGLAKTAYDAWMPNLAPSEALLAAHLESRIEWKDFCRRYREEMRQDPLLDQANRTVKNHGQKFTLRLLQTLAQKQHVTILCHCSAEERHCHRHLLKELIERV